MKQLIDYIESSCVGLGDSHMTYLYKKTLLDDMTERATEITRAGLKDEKVVIDFIIDEFGDLFAGYGDFVKETKKKQRAHFMKYAFPIGGLIALIMIFAAYFSVSYFTRAWDKTWLIIVGGIFAMIIFYFSFAIRKLSLMRRVFHPFARVLLVGSVILFVVFTFLFWLMMLPDETILWPIFPAGIIPALGADLIFAYATGQKFRTISFFVYMPAIATMIYIVLAAYGIVTWIAGWPIILLGIVVDLIYIAIVLMYNIKYFVYKREVE